MHFVGGFGVKKKESFLISAPGRALLYTWSISDIFFILPRVQVFRIQMT